jgi:hypothetical protein
MGNFMLRLFYLHRRVSDIHRKETWVDTKTGLDAMAQRKHHMPIGNRNPDVHP